MKETQTLPSAQKSNNQLSLSFDESFNSDSIHLHSASNTDLRILHYLGSKLRLLQPIRNAIADVRPRGSRVCDLFAGSGTVSLGLSSLWNVTSVDIQEYSRVICNGLLNPPSQALDIGKSLKKTASKSVLRKILREAFSNLLEHEKQCLLNAIKNDVDGLCNLLEYGSLLGLDNGAKIPDPLLNSKMNEAWNRLHIQKLDKGNETVITRYFGGIYFSWEQAIDLDALLQIIHQLDESIRDHFLAALLAVASDLVNTVGKQFAQPIKPRDSQGRPKRHLVNQTVRDRNLSVFNRFVEKINQFANLPISVNDHYAIRADYRDVLSNKNIPFDVVYADPPYTRDHYSRYYHVLETMCLYDEPVVSTTKIRSDGIPKLSRGLYREDRHQSPFCIKSQVGLAFEELFGRIAERQIPLVLSYSPYKADAGNRPRLLTIDELLSIAKQHFRNVEYRPVNGISHNKLNVLSRNVDVDYQAEILMVCFS